MRNSGRKLAFASEVKALLHVPEIEPEIDLESLHQYLTFLWVPDPKTMFRGILQTSRRALRNLSRRRIEDPAVLGSEFSPRGCALLTTPKPILPTKFASVFGSQWKRKW